MKSVTDSLLANAQVPAEESQAEESDGGWSGSGSDESAPEAGADEPTEDADTPPTEGGDEAEASPPAASTAVAAPVGAGSFAVASRIDAAHLLTSVETFFRVAEPSSPIPTLLVRARGYFGKDFSAILNELMPPEPSSGSE
jgi:type VI secretion system protein ImpA